ncbi:MAG: 3-phosphoshikimate 1-carboxyvinyltransferase [Thermoleophilia bacterium]|nr:3-phosphoshikimate 1-carboxyvinyltransferase [Thermoleophilia bacterium]
MRRIEPAGAVVGHIAVPGDKSISHRAVLLGAVAEGETRVEGFGRSADTEATVAAARALGAQVEEEDVDRLVLRGRGLRGLAEPRGPIDCGNAGTLLRLACGLLAGQEGRRYELTGDASLAARPMERVAEPLRGMGARVETTQGGAPVTVEGVASLRAIDCRLPVASAQVKSAVLLAGLSAAGRTTVVEPAPTRDHTELLLESAGARVRRRPTSVSVERAERLALGRVEVPGDFSAAAPFVVAATLLSGSELTIHGVGLNPRRTGLLDVLERMGARIAVYNRRRLGREPVGDLEVRSAPLVATTVTPSEVPLLIDELPLLALAAGFARGETVVRGVGELRTKESDRVESVTTALRAVGVRIASAGDRFRVRGVPSRPRGGGVDAAGDHRIAMLGAVAGLVSREGVELDDPDVVGVSFPGFFDVLATIARRG